MGGWWDALGGQVRDLRDALVCRLDELVTATGNNAAAVIGTARSLAYQYGTPPEAGALNLAPRSMLELPWIAEGSTPDQVTLSRWDIEGRYGFAGYLANIGDAEFMAAWIGHGGQVSGSFSVPPAATVQVPCIVRGVVVLPVDGEPARYQVSLS